MVMVINKKIKRTMLENKSQYIGSVVLIIISCLLFTMFNQLSSNLVKLTSSFEKDYVQEDASFVSDKKLTNIPELQSKFNMAIEETRTLDYPASNDKTLRIFSENTRVNIPAVIKGNNLKNGDILVDPAYAGANKLNIGDSITIYDKTFKIAGFMSLPNYIYPLKSESDLLSDPSSFGVAVMGKGDFDNINKGTSFYSIKFNGDKNSLNNSIAQFKDFIRNENVVILKWTNVSENSRVTYISAKIGGIEKVSSTLPIFILILTCILTGIVIWRMLKNESSIIGTLYALGYRKKEIIRHYLMYPISVALMGGIIGTILGALFLRPMLNLMVMFFNIPINSISFDFVYVIVSILLPLVFLIVSGYFVVKRALVLSPVELIRGGKNKGKVSFIERKLKLDRLKFSTKFKVREQLRSVPRSIFLMLGVVLATMLLLLGFTAKSSMDFLMKDTFHDTYKYGYEYVFNSLEQGQPSQGEAFSASPFTVRADNNTIFTICGVSPDSKYIYLKDKAGNKLSTESVIVTRPLADKLKLKPGDTVTVINKLDSREYSVTIDSISETYVGEYIFMPLTEFNDLLKYPSGSYVGLWSKDKLDIPENKLLRTATVDDSIKAFDSILQPMQYSVGIMAFLSFLIGLIVIYVVTSLIIEENKESISLMKIWGYRRKEVNSLILNSSSLLIVIGYILGVPLLLTSLSAMFSSVTKSLNFAFPVTIDYSYVLIGFVVIYFTYVISKTLNRRKVNRISMTEVLKSGME